ncbi:MAG: bifunctional transaldolase/phosoglucose isomerase [Elusimicrobia bacterium]|nr:bifunctional transaldolase/phosoglucose isomerase [Elusimicrobiota bacterium]
MNIESLPAATRRAFEGAVRDWEENRKVRRFWARDSALWTGADESKWLGWLDIAQDKASRIDELSRFQEEVRKAGWSHALLLGMGGSSLAPEVLSKTFPRTQGLPRLRVLDSTNPEQIRAAEVEIDPARTLFIISSKSGTTLEPDILRRYFFSKAQGAVGAGKAGRQFVAITDPGSSLEETARGDGFSRIFHGDPAVGGRFSALSAFGLVPAALMGLDFRRLLESAERMRESCKREEALDQNPGAFLGLFLGILALAGKDKLTLIVSPKVAPLGGWLEQLVAESTGKSGRAIIPVDGEPLGPPGSYGDDRVFAYIRLDSEPEASQDSAVRLLENAGHPVVRSNLRDSLDLGAEFFRWEVATAVAGSILGIHPFNQPDVEASKIAARDLTAEFEKKGSFPKETPLCEEGEIGLYADSANWAALKAGARDKSLAGCLRAHVDRLRGGDYFALLAYLEMNPENERALGEMRNRIRDKTKTATCLGFGPRFLHSTGQAYKGGPGTGVFIEITADPAADLPVPGRKCTFGAVQLAQARGDFQVLLERGRRAIRLHLSRGVRQGLRDLRVSMEKAIR